MLAVVLLARMGPRNALLAISRLRGLPLLLILPRQLVLYIGTDVVHRAVQLVEDKRHTAFVGRALLVGVLGGSQSE